MHALDRLALRGDELEVLEQRRIDLGQRGVAELEAAGIAGGAEELEERVVRGAHAAGRHRTTPSAAATESNTSAAALTRWSSSRRSRAASGASARRRALPLVHAEHAHQRAQLVHERRHVGVALAPDPSRSRARRSRSARSSSGSSISFDGAGTPTVRCCCEHLLAWSPMNGSLPVSSSKNTMPSA